MSSNHERGRKLGLRQARLIVKRLEYPGDACMVIHSCQLIEELDDLINEITVDRHGNENRIYLNGRFICQYTWPDGDYCGLPWDHEEPHADHWMERNGPETD